MRRRRVWRTSLHCENRLLECRVVAEEGGGRPCSRKTHRLADRGGMAPTQVLQVTDQGWAWVVLMAVLISQGLSLGYPSCVGVFYKDIQASFQATNSETSWLPSIVTAVLHAGGPICSILVECYGCRVAVFLGGILAGVGMVSSSFAQNIFQLYLTAGFITGLGLSLAFQAGITVLGYYFVRRRILANAFASSGASIGMAAWPLISQYLLNRMGWRGTFLIFGGVLLNCCVCGSVMRPNRPPPSALGAAQQTNEDDRQKSSPSPQLPTTSCIVSQQSSSGCRLKKYLAFDLLCHNKRYQIYTLSITWLVMGFMLPLFYLVPYATSSGIEESRAAMLVSTIGLINIIGRPLAGFISQMACLKGQLLYVVSTAAMVNSLSNLIAALWNSYAMLLVYCVVFSISMSFLGSLVFQVLMDIVGMERFPGAFGLFTIMGSITILIGPPLAGLLVDFTGHYRYIFYAITVNGCSAALFLGLSAFALKRKEAKLQETAKLAKMEPLMGEPKKTDEVHQNPPEVIFLTTI
ncbi:monocarboxylate transporter 6-like isoform X2 [Ambystoma mexicanum]|uniref:monocarboxylate transporter 6-like isoform X2 n=1 Tax=Ambystoma mexicanum TaxID=8296 RepID=UPI0037E99F89